MSHHNPLATRTFWLHHAVWPALLFALFVTVATATGLDESLARAWAFDLTSGQFIGAGGGEWWAKDLIHSVGGLVIRTIGGVLLLLWGLSFRFRTLRRWRRPAGFVLLCAVLGAGAVGVLKETTNVACPWALAEFGGLEPYVRLFADRPDALPKAQCFPGGHSSSGFALFPLYFLWLGRNRRRARVALAAAVLVGGVFAFGQEARGAHFLSHDVWSAALLWFACVGVYAFGYKGELWEPREAQAAGQPDLRLIASPAR